jgi:ribosomal protein S12 methylthiotransferase
MRRAGGARRVRKTVSWVREALPRAFIRTEIMVGFPGETEREFDELLAFLEEARFERIGIFRYEDERGTRSFRMDDKVTEEEISERYGIALSLADSLMQEAQRSLISRVLPVIVDHGGSGRTPYDAPDIDCSVRLRGPAASRIEPGEILDVRIEGTRGLDLFGTPVPTLPRGRSPSPGGRGKPKALL